MQLRATSAESGSARMCIEMRSLQNLPRTLYVYTRRLESALPGRHLLLGGVVRLLPAIFLHRREHLLH